MIDFRQLRYFSILAEELHFRRAAERLHIVQSALSMQIKALEEDLGTQLLERDSRHVRLTQAGEVLRNEARTLLAGVESAAELTRATGDGQIGRIRIGVSASATASGILAGLIRKYRLDRPGVQIELTEMHPVMQPRALLDHRIDLGFGLPEAFRDYSDEIKSLWLSRFPIELVVSSYHRLASFKRVSGKDLREETFIGLSEQDEHASTYLARATLGYEPVKSIRASNQVMMMSMVEANLGIGVVSSALKRIAVSDVKFLKISEAQLSFDLYLFRRSDETEKPVLQFWESVLVH